MPISIEAHSASCENNITNAYGVVTVFENHQTKKSELNIFFIHN
jgi:hypothetical protein